MDRVYSGTKKIGIGTNNLQSYVTSPTGSPDYPVLELATFVLFGVGLLALVGYVGYRKRHRAIRRTSS
jgi:hypothetical protein